MIQALFYLFSIIAMLIFATSQYTQGYQQALLDEAESTQEVVPGIYNTDTIHRLVNIERKNNNLPELEHNDLLCNSAEIRARESITNWSHDGFEREAVILYLIDDNILGTGENLSRKFTSEYEMVQAWMLSPGHRENILDVDFTDGCVRCVQDNCAHIFATLRTNN